MVAATLFQESRRRGTARFMVIAFATFLMMATIGHVAFAADPVYDGRKNPKCDDLNEGWSELKVQPPESGDYSDDTVEVSVELTEDEFGTLVAWESDPGLVAVIVKGGDSANVYYYDPAATSDEGLHTPWNGDDKYFGLSHISFCYDPAGDTDGGSDDGTADDGSSDDGSADDGSSDDGSSDDGSADDGSSDDGSSDDGSSDDGSSDDGSSDDGSSDDGASDDGQADDGASDDGTEVDDTSDGSSDGGNVGNEVLGSTQERDPLATTGSETTVLAIIGFAMPAMGAAMRMVKAPAPAFATSIPDAQDRLAEALRRRARGWNCNA